MNDYMRRRTTGRGQRGGRPMPYGNDYGRGNYEVRGDYENDYRGRRDSRAYGEDYNYEDEYEMDGRRGVRGTGRYGIGGSRYYGRDRGMYDEEYEDYGEDMRLTKRDIKDWKEDLENADGTHGEHFDMNQIMQAMQALNIQPRNFTDKEFALTVNALYSDYCEALREVVPQSKELMIYAKMAKAFLEDKDACVRGGDKLAAYYFAIVCDE